MLHSDVNRQLYHGLSQPWTSWEDVARLAIEKTRSRSRLILKENAKGPAPDLFDLGKIENDFGLRFDPWPRIVELVQYLAARPAEK